MTDLYTDETAREIINNLPSWYPRSESSPNFKLFRAPSEQAGILNADINAVQASIRPQDDMAQSMDIASGEEIVIRDGRVEYRKAVTVDGTLRVEGTLYTEELTIGSNGTVIENGKIVIENQLSEFIERLEKLGALVQVYPYDSETVAHYRARIIAEYAVMTCEGTNNDILVSISEILNVPKSSIEIVDRINPGEIEVRLPALALQNTELQDTEIGNILTRLLAASYSLEALQLGTFTYITPSQYDINDHDSELGYDGLDGNGDPKDNGGTYAGLIT